ncbi:hypothetical protein PBY51_015259 [Eleginops maclovinus]|uniref:Autophagy-related protein 16 domain-containing protein n=1 Tax=Eleginops maclovinus TaxID=56733 RepID=A0AAN7X3Z8_ELEMC|nr:hypothetical protein PBY51_015259 [Eleginops maclovinus]
MRSWKNHVRGELQQRDQTEKLPFIGVFTSLSQMEERFEFRKTFLDDVQSKSLDREKLSQTVSDLTTVLYLKEAELQYWQSRVSHYRQEALSLAKRSNTLKTTLSEFEYTIECQSKELAALRNEQKGINEALALACREKDELLQRWMEEKREEADRLNKYNDAQERWQRVAKHLKKHLHSERKKEFVPIVTNSWYGEK